MEQSTMESKRRAWGSARHSESRKVISEPWNEDEDRKLARLVERIGKKDWCMVASVMEGRTARQCRERYCNHVDEAITRGVFSCNPPPVRARRAKSRRVAMVDGGSLCCAARMGAADVALNRCAGPWTAQEDAVIIDAQARLGNKWIDVAALLPGRTANSIKNRWNATLLPRMRRQVVPRPVCPVYMDAAMVGLSVTGPSAPGRKRCADASTFVDHTTVAKKMCQDPWPHAAAHVSSASPTVRADMLLMGMHDLRAAHWSMLSHFVARQQHSAVPVLPQLKLATSAGYEQASAPARSSSTSSQSTEYGASSRGSRSPVRKSPDESGTLPSMRSYISSTLSCAADALLQTTPGQSAQCTRPVPLLYKGVSVELRRALLQGMQQQHEQQQLLLQQQQQQQHELELLLHLRVNNQAQKAAAIAPAESASNNLNLLLTALMREEFKDKAPQVLNSSQVATPVPRQAIYISSPTLAPAATGF
jgi:hypothetical protein